MSRLSLLEALELKHPLIVAPMAGGPSSVELVAVSSEAGALGFVGGAYSSPSILEDFLQKVRAKTKKSFGVNLFIPNGAVELDPKRVSAAIQQTQGFRAELSLPPPVVAAPFEENFDLQFEVVLRQKPKAFSFVFGKLESHSISELKRAGIFVIGTATKPDEALVLEASGIDAVVLQGVEAGGHRGIFDAKSTDPDIGALSLLQSLVGKTQIPLIAAGGIMNREDIRKMLSAGAQAVQMGTAFLATTEAATSHPYRERLLANEVRETKLTRAFSGRLARGLVNRFMSEMDAHPEAVLPYPVQNKFTRDIRTASAKAGSAECLSLWSGSGKGKLWTGSAKGLITDLFS